MESTLKRTWSEIDLDALVHNYKTLRQRIGDKVRFLGVVKADAYGHGSVMVAKTLEEEGADYLAVSSIDEAMELRVNDIKMPVLILGHTPKEQVDRLIEYNITQAVTCKAKAVEYSEEATRLNKTLKIHIKVDTGMSRLGYLSPVWSRNLTLSLMAEADREQWPIVVHDCSNRTKFARDLHLRAQENGWFGSTTYGMEFDQIPCYAFLPVLYDPDFTFLEEEELPRGFRFGDIVL